MSVMIHYPFAAYPYTNGTGRKHFKSGLAGIAAIDDPKSTNHPRWRLLGVKLENKEVAPDERAKIEVWLEETSHCQAIENALIRQAHGY